MSYSVLQASLVSAVLAATPLLYAGLGELLSERVGVLNIGIEGIMLIGAAVGYIVAVSSGNNLLALVAGAAAGAGLTLTLFAFPAVVLGTPQVLVGFAVFFIGAGLSDQIGDPYTTRALDSGISSTAIPLLSDIPFIGPIFFRQIWPFYVAVVLILAVAFLFRRSRHGRDMRALGESPGSAYSVGIAVIRWRLFYVTAGGALIGFGGGVLSVAITQTWQQGMTAGRGWVALALVIFAGWRPIGLLWGAYVFGVLLVLSNLGQAQGWGIPSPFLSMAPYVVTVAILILRTWRENRGMVPTLAPAALGQPFVRGGR